MKSKVHDLYDGLGAESFGALLKRLEDVWKKLKLSLAQGSSSRRLADRPGWTDQELLAQMSNWIQNGFNGSCFNDFAAFARQFCQVDVRPEVVELKDILFPPEFPEGRLVFHERLNCWTLGLSQHDQGIAINAFFDARLLAAETFLWLMERDNTTELLCKKYFDPKGRKSLDQTVSKLEEEFERLHSALESNISFVLCRGNPQRSGKRTLAYVDPGLDYNAFQPGLGHNVFLPCARASRCIYLNEGFFRGGERQTEFSISGEHLLFHGMTILHELTHHILKTDDIDDWYYGRDLCFQLPLRKPWEEAITNADSFALFARDVKLCKNGSRPSFLNGI